MKIYNHTCSICNKEITYTSYKSYWTAKHRNGMCKSCRSATANKSSKRNSKKERNSQWKGYEEIPYGWFSKYFERANKRTNNKRTGDITIQDVHSLWTNQNKKCALSGISIGFYDDGKNHTCSIDRIDSLKEYTLDNIQLVHKHINLMKNKFDNQYFIDMCKLIAGGACEIQ
jgi:hypothetical protein